MRSFFLVFILFPLFSFSLPVSQQSFVYKLLDDKSFYKLGNFLGKEGINLVYARFGQRRGEKGSIAVIVGRDESLLKYIELFYDLMEEGYSPIYTYDHRDQGFSDRLPSERNTGHVEEFTDYTRDFENFVQDVVLKDPLVNKNRLFAISHSMGGAVLMDYLQTTKKPVFRSVVFSSPMFRVPMDPIRRIMISGLSIVCLFRACDASFIPPTIKFYFLLSDSPERIDFLKFMREEKCPEFKTGPPSLRWLVESSGISRELSKPERIQKIHTPFLIIQSMKDKIVSNRRQNKICNQIQNCCHLKVSNGKHETFIETDLVRDEAISEILKFFSETRKNRRKCISSRSS